MHGSFATEAHCRATNCAFRYLQTKLREQHCSATGTPRPPRLSVPDNGVQRSRLARRIHPSKSARVDRALYFAKGVWARIRRRAMGRCLCGPDRQLRAATTGLSDSLSSTIIQYLARRISIRQGPRADHPRYGRAIYSGSSSDYMVTRPLTPRCRW